MRGPSTSASRRFLTSLTLAASIAVATLCEAQSNSPIKPEESSPVSAGTLNIILANHNGAVVGADSRRSSESPFLCNGKPQKFCDDSQKLFSTGPESVVVIAGYAVGGENSLVDFGVASTIRGEFGPNGLISEDLARKADSGLRSETALALQNVSDVYGAGLQLQPLSLFFVRIDESGVPIVRQALYQGSWQPDNGQLKAVYQETDSPEVKVTGFFKQALGIPCVADEILRGHYITSDPVIKEYYTKLANHELDDASLEFLDALARTILKETKKFSDQVGGEDQIAMFPAKSAGIVALPDGVTAQAKSVPNVLRWNDIQCSNQTPPCGKAGVIFDVHPNRMQNRYLKYYFNSKFTDIPVVLDKNIFIANTFANVTFKWNGDTFTAGRNSVTNCKIEMRKGLRFPPSEFSSCQIVEVSTWNYPDGTVGAPPKQTAGGAFMYLIPEP